MGFNGILDLFVIRVKTKILISCLIKLGLYLIFINRKCPIGFYPSNAREMLNNKTGYF